jgi:hypothetical protein
MNPRAGAEARPRKSVALYATATFCQSRSFGTDVANDERGRCAIKQTIKRVGDKQRQADLMDLYTAAEVPVTRAVNAGHMFVYDQLQAHLVKAQPRADRLMAAHGNRVE